MDSSLWLEGLGGSRRDPNAARLYLSLPVSSRPKISYLFDPVYYCETNPDVSAGENDPLVHFIDYGCREARSPHPLIDLHHLRTVDPFSIPEFPTTQDLYDVLHFDLIDPSPYFSIGYYRDQLGDESGGVVGCLEHFLKSGLLRGMKPNPLFDPLWYYRQLEGAHDVWSGLRHFVLRGDKEARAPSPDFSAQLYLERYGDVAASGTPPLRHYLVSGNVEGRPFQPEKTPASLVLAESTSAVVAAVDETESLRSYKTLKERISERRQSQKDTVSASPPRILKFGQPLGQIERLALPRFDNPQVSILIPIYNEIDYTVECISSILSSNPTVSYEVVIADDASTDETTQELRYLPNIKYVRRQFNSGFLRNCNNAFHSCTGRYILLLNNDAQLLPGSLDALVDILESDSNVAAVGPKMLYPNGRLQEAGCAVDRDGVSTMVGLFADPGDAAYNYTRDVHYCSGAALLVRRSELGDELFDDAFNPAYCEDTDLCLRLLSKGRRIVYCPKAEIVHHLSVSTNRQSVTRRLQLVARNQQKLARKYVAGRPQSCPSDRVLSSTVPCNRGERLLLGQGFYRMVQRRQGEPGVYWPLSTPLADRPGFL